MRIPTVLAALAVAPVISAQSVTSAATSVSTVFSTETGLPCSTLRGPTPFVIFGITTSFQFTYTVTQNNTLPPTTLHSANTVTVTRNSTTVTSLVTTTATATVTSTSTPAAVTVSPSPGWLPLQGAQAVASATPLPRIARGQLQGQSTPFDLFKREEPITRQIGWIADPNTGDRVPLEQTWYTLAIFCPIRITQSLEYHVTDPEVTTTQQATGTAVATTTVTTTTSMLVSAATPTFWAACQANNIVNHIDYDNNGLPMYFDGVYFRRGSGNNTDINEIGVDATDPVDCCIKCQSAAEGCSEAFFVPGEGKCQMRLRRTISPVQSGLPLPSEFPTGTATGAIAASTGGVNINAVCPGGSLSDYVGVIRGRESFKRELAWSFTNGPCGRLSVNTVPQDFPGNVTTPSETAVGVLPVSTPFKRAVKLLS
ncbi:uncharacterized protein N0V89_005619 [Didymosphaeria variabile]|uniref:Apple domain-containing protein n=1 Tax=Didymosphaeria variabile TaxID=1932322 RepID=A0A9W9CBN1_9PLEO|nr:uncharacterized protein N0V89_005619 [Didymosphaeria variabile]KAJ4353889.1 hypothetical protein N0V89_005619 [Didymosphaeria variabile]